MINWLLFQIKLTSLAADGKTKKNMQALAVKINEIVMI